MKTTTYMVDGETIEFIQPSIKKDFWFPEDDRTREDHERTWARVASCETEDYFMSENLDSTRAARLLRCLSENSANMYVVHDYGRGESFVGTDYDRDGANYAGARKLSADGAEQLRDACEREQAKFEKRLRTYLKRYGLSKCNFDTYWSMR
ncbi:MAG: hypothetical protein PUI67_05585 [Collinsella sp.]|nr:hypothetical protein [Collinsella sp.]MDY5267363.1 hypothetical protein [Collinsella sp.]MDY6149669.1 hypothetical protein [Collinsella sp.]